MSALFDHAVRLYDALQALPGEDVEGGRLVTGKRTEVFRSIKVSQAHYSILYKTLESMGCIEHVEVGGRGKPSKMLLAHPPEPELFDQMRINHLTANSETANLLRRVEMLERRLDGVDIKGAMVEIGRRLLTLENQGR